MKTKKKIIVVGAGAAGLMAAGQAALLGAEVHLLERKEKPANKLRISGKGRCNLTNNTDIHDFLSHFNREARFLHQTFSHFFAPELIDFFENLGVKLVTERGRRVFPASGKSSEVIASLLNWIRSCGAELHLSTRVKKILTRDSRVRGIISSAGEMKCDGLILATGGASYPTTGSSGDGYVLAKECGHSITPLRPALIPLVVESKNIRQLAGLDLRNVSLRIYFNGKRKISDFGEVSFSTTGLGGPLTLTHSLRVVEALQRDQHIEVSLDLKPALDEHKLDKRLIRDLEKRYDEQIASILRGLLPQKLVEVALILCAIDSKKKGNQITGEERIRLRRWLKDFRFCISGVRPLAEAIVTAGGVNLGEVEASTLQSKKVSGLYLAGELLNLNGDTGGYNLQAAFSTGWMAGRSAALKE